MSETRKVETPEQGRRRLEQAKRWIDVDAVLTELIGDVDGTTAAVDRVLTAMGRMKGVDRTYAIRNLATRAMSCQHYHSARRGLDAEIDV